MDKNALWDKFVTTVNLADEPMPGKSLVEIVGDQCVLIENHCGIISYGKDMITVKTKNGWICVKGMGLCLSKMSREQIRIVGRIHHVELQGRGTCEKR